METMNTESRRDFLKKTGAVATGIALGGTSISAKSYRRIIGANERLNLAVIGCYRRAGAFRGSFGELKDHLNIAYVCDVVKARRDAYAASLKEAVGYVPPAVNDFREVLADEKVDAVFQLTPDHWHGPGSYMAMKAGKHVYVEKPLSHNPHEGDLFLKFRDRYDRLVMMGTQQRSQLSARKVIKEIHDGLIGKVYHVVAHYANQRGSIGNGTVVPVPGGFDWDLFQGPAPREVFRDIYFDYNWHWFWPWGTGETGNNATHEFDVARWVLQVEHPEGVFCNAGKYHFVDDDWTMYDTMDVTFTYPGGKSIRWDGKSRTNYHTYGSDRGNVVFGSEGTVTITRNGFKQFDLKGKLVREENEPSRSVTTAAGGEGDITTSHIFNFLQAVRGKEKPNVSLEESVKSTHLVHLANIAYRAGASLQCDPVTGHILDREVMERYWSREYEQGWEPEI